MNIAMITITLLFILHPMISAAGTLPDSETSPPVPTQITVHVLAHGAKAMYPRLGARVMIRNAETREILAQGEVQGSSGDTASLMKAGYPRTFGKYGLTREDTGMIAAAPDSKDGRLLLPLTPENIQQKGTEIIPYTSRSDAARFVGTIRISEPTVIQVEAVGPLKHPQATMSDSITALVLPGRHVAGEGIVLNLRGLVVDILSPEKNQNIAVSGEKQLNVTFNMSMMCGCPVFDHPDNPWKTDMFTFPIEAYAEGKLYYHKEISAGEIITDVSTFMFSLPLPEKVSNKKTEIRIRVMAAQPDLANYGMDEVTVFLQ